MSTPEGAAPEGEKGVDLDQKVRKLLSVGEECQTEGELRNLLQKKPNFVLYDGFEPSGRMHIAQGVFKSVNVNKCTESGGTFKFWVADWFALMNDKMGGDLEKIQTVGKYFVEVWKGTGMQMDNVQFICCADALENSAHEYWPQMMDIARVSSLARIKKCGQIMGRADEDKLTAAQILYPLMQCCDIFLLKADITQLGMDQRKVNMLARDYCDAVKRKLKPIILSHHMLHGLTGGKMSKSDPNSAIFMEDAAEDVERKLLNAYCPLHPAEGEDILDWSKRTLFQNESGTVVDPLLVGERSFLKFDEVKDAISSGDVTEEALAIAVVKRINPVLDYVRYIVFQNGGSTGVEPLEVDGEAYTSFEAVCKALLVSKHISPEGLKAAVAKRVNTLIEPVRQRFETDPEAMRVLELVQSYKKEALEAELQADKSGQKKRPQRGLKVLEESKLEGGDYNVVFAPQMGAETPQLRLAQVLQTLACLRKGKQSVLWLEDWTSFVRNRALGDKAGIAAFYSLLVETLRLLAPDVMSRTLVLTQSAAILRNPNAYWISVIDAGRVMNMGRIGAMQGEDPLKESSQVVASLMHVADVLALTDVGSRRPAITVPETAKGRTAVAAEYCAELCAGDVLAVEAVDGFDDIVFNARVAGGTADLFIGEAEPSVNGKLKKAFCEEGTAALAENPLLVLMAQLVKAGLLCEGEAGTSGEAAAPALLEVRRKEEFGGDKDYHRLRDIAGDFAEKRLHPGDLKKPFAGIVKSALKALDGSAAVKAGVKELEAVAKKLAKGKK